MTASLVATARRVPNPRSIPAGTVVTLPSGERVMLMHATLTELIGKSASLSFDEASFHHRQARD